MDNASDYGSEDSRFENFLKSRGQTSFSCTEYLVFEHPLCLSSPTSAESETGGVVFSLKCQEPEPRPSVAFSLLVGFTRERQSRTLQFWLCGAMGNAMDNTFHYGSEDSRFLGQSFRTNIESLCFKRRRSQKVDLELNRNLPSRRNFLAF